jgi:hypothetical protein
MRILDWKDKDRGEEWLYGNFGDIIIRQPEVKPAYFITQLRERIGPANVDVWVHPYDRVVRVAWSWPEAPSETEEQEPKGKAYYEATEAGKVGFPMDPNAYYDPKTDIGPHTIWVKEIDENGTFRSAYIEGIGMAPGAVHRHIEPTFKWITEEPQTVEERVIDEADALRERMRLPLPVGDAPNPFKYPQVLADHGYSQGAGYEHFEDDEGDWWGWQIGFKTDGRWGVVYSLEKDYDKWILLEFAAPWEGGQLLNKIEAPENGGG